MTPIDQWLARARQAEAAATKGPWTSPLGGREIVVGAFEVCGIYGMSSDTNRNLCCALRNREARVLALVEAVAESVAATEPLRSGGKWNVERSRIADAEMRAALTNLTTETP